MQTLPRDTRILMGCGFEPPHPSAKPWRPPAPPASKLGYQYKLPTVCAGYLTRQPEVIEVARAHAHWTKGSLVAFCGGEPTEQMLEALEVLDGELSRLKTWALTDKKDGGGRS